MRVTLIYSDTDRVEADLRIYVQVLVRVVGILNVEGPFFVTQLDSSAYQRSTSWVESALRTLLMLIGEPELWDDEADRAKMDRDGDSSDEVSNVLLALLMPMWQLSSSVIHAKLLVSWGGVSAVGRWLSRIGIGPLRPPLETMTETGAHGFELRTQLALRTALCGLLCCLSRIGSSHAEFLRPMTCHGLLSAVGVDHQGKFGAAPNQGPAVAAGSTEWEAFVLGILRNILLADRSKPVCTSLRPFVPWLVECLTIIGGSSALSLGDSKATAVKLVVVLDVCAAIASHERDFPSCDMRD